MINFGNIIKENIKEKNPNWSKIPDHSYRILIIGDFSIRTKIIIYLI